MSYATRIKTIERLIAEIERSDDVENAMKLHAEVEEHLKICKTTIEQAHGELEEVNSIQSSHIKHKDMQ